MARKSGLEAVVPLCAGLLVLMGATGSVAELDVFFAPYDVTTAVPQSNLSTLQADIALIQNVTAAKVAWDAAIQPTQAAALNPFAIQFCV